MPVSIYVEHVQCRFTISLFCKNHLCNTFIKQTIFVIKIQSHITLNRGNRTARGFIQPWIPLK